MVAAEQREGAPGARRVYEALRTRLAADMRIEPEASTTGLLRELGAAAQTVDDDNSASTGAAAATALLGIPRVLILPPLTEASNMGRGQTMLVASFVDEVIHTLARSRTFAVFGPHTARQLASPAFPRGNPYGVDYLVTMRVLASMGPGQFMLGITLTRVATQEVLMSEEMVFSSETLSFNHFAMALSLAAHISRRVGATEMQLYRRTGAASAFVHYLLGNEYLGRFVLQNVRAARNHYKQALKLSPRLSPARSMLARSLCLEWLLLQRHDKELIDTSLALARAALAEDPLDPMAHREVGHALLYLDQLDAGVEAFEDGVRLGPHHADLLFHYGDGLAHLGRLQEARTAIDKALSLNPLAPDLYHWVSATTDYFLGKYASASASLEKLNEKEPAARVIALVEAMNGNMAKAHRYRDIFMRSHPEFRLANYSIPQKRREDRDHFLEGMRRAGFV
jgi:tetratricopeptide (TPR) repeat protein/TolB-like protein